MRRTWSVLRAFALVGAALLLYRAAGDLFAWAGNRRGPMPTTCYGPADARLRIVYLHGIDTRGPSWIEVQNRTKLRVLAERLHARIALPRAPSGWWEHSTAGATDQSLAIVRRGAQACFGGREDFGVIAFSYGAGFANDLFVQCRTDEIRWTLSAGGVGIVPSGAGSLQRCGPIRVMAGRHEPVFAQSEAFVRQLRAHGADAEFIAHPGPHELPFEETLAALEPLEAIDGK